MQCFFELALNFRQVIGRLAVFVVIRPVNAPHIREPLPGLVQPILQLA